MVKLKLTIPEQIGHMKNEKGIKFNIINEEEAKTFLSESTYYFKLKAFMKNFEKYHTEDKKDQYVNLEFALLQELSILDSLFRKLILKTTMDIEHFLKVKLLYDFSRNEKEDGYNIVKECLYRLQSKVMVRENNSPYSKEIMNKYKDNYAIWNIIEVMTFGQFVHLFQYYYNQYPDSSLTENKVLKMLFNVNKLRNAAAHNNCVLNRFGNEINYKKCEKHKANYSINKILSQYDEFKLKNKNRYLDVPIIGDFACVLHVFNNVVTSKKTAIHTYDEFGEFFDERLVSKADLFSSHNNIKMAFNYLYNIYKVSKRSSPYYCEELINI